MSDTPDNRVRLTTRSERSSTFIELGSWIITHKRYIKSACRLTYSSARPLLLSVLAAIPFPDSVISDSDFPCEDTTDSNQELSH